MISTVRIAGSDIAAVAQEHGGETPFTRPDELSDDLPPTPRCCALSWLNANGPRVTRLCCSYARAPFLRPEDLRRG